VVDSKAAQMRDFVEFFLSATKKASDNSQGYCSLLDFAAIRKYAAFESASFLEMRRTSSCLLIGLHFDVFNCGAEYRTCT